MGTVLLNSLNAWWPETMLGAGALVVMLLGAAKATRFLVMVAAWAAILAAACALWLAPVPPPAGMFYGLIVCDPFSLTFRWIALGTIAIVLLLVMASRETEPSVQGEYVGLLLLIGLGVILMAEANHLLMAYLAMELVSLSSYVLVGLLQEPRSAEASLKYLLFGALSSGMMLFGMSLLYGATGQLGFPELQRAAGGTAFAAQGAVLIAAALLLAGLAFKISMVPFHMWTPDAYEGAPVPVAALLSVGPKAAGLALLVRVVQVLGPVWGNLRPLLIVLTIVTMTLGNLAALTQTNVKRLLAYSTIGQVGYLLIGFVVNSSMGIDGLLFYLVAYLFMNLGAFACVVAVENATRSESIEAFRGLGQRSPGLALVCALFLLSLAGIPPLAGFFGKFLLFGSAIQTHHWWLAMAGILNSAVALYYYVNIIRLMYFVAPTTAAPVTAAAPLRMAVACCAFVTLLFGLLPGPLLALLHATTGIHLL